MNVQSTRVPIEHPESLFIGGEWKAPAAGEYFETVDPSNGEKLASVGQGSLADIDSAVRAARAASPLIVRCARATSRGGLRRPASGCTRCQKRRATSARYWDTTGRRRSPDMRRRERSSGRRAGPGHRAGGVPQPRREAVGI